MNFRAVNSARNQAIKLIALAPLSVSGYAFFPCTPWDFSR